MSNTRSAPNVNLLPRKISVNTGIRSNVKTLPRELLTRKEQRQTLPYLSAPRVLSKAEKWATDWFHRTKELEQADAYHERIRLQLNLPETGTPLRAKDVRIVNLDELTKKMTKGVNDNVNPSPLPNPQLPQRLPPSQRNAGSQTHNVAQINPLTRELSTTSTQTMREMADASTSARPTVATGTTQTDKEPPSGEDMALMSLDAPIQQIVNNYANNYNTVNHILHQHHNEYNQLNQYATLNNYHQVMNDSRSVQNVIQNNLHQQNLLQHLENRPTTQNVLQVGSGDFTFQAPAITGRRQALIEAPQNGVVRQSRVVDRRNTVMIPPLIEGALGDLPVSRKRKVEAPDDRRVRFASDHVLTGGRKSIRGKTPASYTVIEPEDILESSLTLRQSGSSFSRKKGKVRAK